MLQGTRGRSNRNGVRPRRRSLLGFCDARTARASRHQKQGATQKAEHRQRSKALLPAFPPDQNDPQESKAGKLQPNGQAVRILR